MKNEKYLFEEESVLRAVMDLAIPSIMGQIILVIYNMADTLFIGMTRSDAMITSVTVCMPAFMFLSAISNLFGIGGSSVISRAKGAGDAKRSRRASAFAFWGCLAVSFVYCTCVWIFRDPFLNVLGGASPDVHRASTDYLLAAVVLGGVPTAMCTFFSHLLRAHGHSRLASGGIILGGLLNMGLDPLFMFVLLPRGREAFGAAVATALSNGCSLLYYIGVLYLKRNEISVSFRPTGAMLCNSIPRDVLLVGLPACLMTLCENISYAVLDNLMAFAGTAAQAGIGVAKKVNMFAHCFVRGMSQGVLPLIGYNYASGNRRRMRSIIRLSAGISLGAAILCMAACLLFGESLISLFIRTRGESLLFGSCFLRILCLGAPFSSVAYTVISLFQATGKGSRSLLLALLRKGVLDIPLMFALHRLLPVRGIVWATPITDIVCCGIALLLYLRFIKKASRKTSRKQPVS